MYAPMHVIFLSEQKTPDMDKCLYFFLHTDHMLPKFLKDVEDQSNNLLIPGVKKILEDTKYAASEAADSDGEYDENYE